MNALRHLWMRLRIKRGRQQAQRKPESGATWPPEPRGDFMQRLEAIRREIEARPQSVPPAQVGETAQAGKHHREFTRAVLAMEQALNTLGCRTALAVLRDSGLTGSYVEGPLAIRQDYIAAPNGEPLYPPCAAVILRKPGYVMDQPPHTHFKAWYAGVWACQDQDSRAICLVVGKAEEPTDGGAGEQINIPVGESAIGETLYDAPGSLDYVQAKIESWLLDWAREESLSRL